MWEGYASSNVGHKDAPNQVLSREGWGWQRGLSTQPSRAWDHAPLQGLQVAFAPESRP